MCKFIIVEIFGNDIPVKKQAAMCEAGMKGNMCIDSQKVMASPYNNAINCMNQSTLTSRTSTSLSLILENILKTHIVRMEYSLIKPYISKMVSMSATEIYTFYNKLKQNQELSQETVTVEYSIRPSDTMSELPTRIKSAPSVAPSDSISQASTRVSTKSRRDSVHDDRHSIANWVERSSVVSTSTVRPSSESKSRVSASTSSRRARSYAKGKEMVLYEE